MTDITSNRLNIYWYDRSRLPLEVVLGLGINIVMRSHHTSSIIWGFIIGYASMDVPICSHRLW